MKKKILFVCFIFLTLYYTFAQNLDFKYFSDYSKDFSGYAASAYQGNLKDLEISEQELFDKLSNIIDKEIPPVQKLTKKNTWLFRQSLNEWDYEPDEVYLVLCAESKYSTEVLMFFVVIKEKKELKWKAYNVKEDDVYKLEKLFNDAEPITAIPSSEEYVSGQREIYGWYTSLGIIQGKTKDDKPVTIRMDVALAYRNGDAETPKEIQKRTVEIKDFLRRYISEKEAKDFRNTNNEEQLEEEIKNGINEKILSSGRIRDVVFQQKDVIG